MRGYRFVTQGHRTLVFDASGGFVRSMPVFAGGDGEGGDGAGSGDGAGGGAAGSGAGEGGAGAGGDGAAGGEGDGEGGDGGGSSPLEAQALEAIKTLEQTGAQIPQALKDAVSEFRKARDDAAKARTKGKESAEAAAKEAREQIVKDLAKALGLGGDTDDNDPEKLKAAVSEKDKAIADRDNELAALKLERAVHKAARAKGGDEDLVYAYLTTRPDLKQLDVSADGLDEQVSKLVQAALDEKSNLKTSSTPSSSGPDLGGGGPADGKPKSREDAIAAHYAKA